MFLSIFVLKKNVSTKFVKNLVNTDFYEMRSLEIQDYLSKRKVENIVIVDDMKIAGFDEHFVLINPATGLTENDVEKENIILNNSSC